MDNDQNKKKIGMALLKALACWIGLYTVVSHVHMLWTWPSDTTSSTSSIVETIPQQEPQEENDDVREWNLAAQGLSQQFHHVTLRHAQSHDTTQQQVSLLKHNVHVMSQTQLPNRTTKTAKAPKLQKLLSQSNLQLLTDKELRSSVKQVRDEMDSLLKQDWFDGWNALLQETHPREAPMAQRCQNNGNEDTLPNTARLSDLYTRVNKVEHSLVSNRNLKAEPPLSTRESTLRVVAAIQQAVVTRVNKQQQLQSPVEENNEPEEDDACIGLENVEWLVEEGLDGLLRRLDLRVVLQKALAEIDEEAAEHVILDAVLSSRLEATDTTLPKINLRHLLETPLVTKQAPQWLDVAVEHAGGHVDLVDQTLDSMLEHGQEESVGKLVISKLLAAAAKVDIPNVDNYINIKAGMLRL